MTCSLAFRPAGANVTPHSSSVQKKIKVDTLFLPGMNVGLERARVAKVNDKTVLTYTFTNETGVPLESLQFVAFFVGPDGNIRGGEGWTINAALGARASQEVPVALQRQVSDDERVLLAVYRARGRKVKFEIEPPNVVDALQSMLSAKSAPAAGARYVKTAARLPQTVNPCIDAQAFAEKTCKCGIKTFSCNSSTGQYSFECFGADGPSCPKTPPRPN
jgi:hypothetical protein